MATHDILVYDDDPRALQLRIRSLLATDALAMLRSELDQDELRKKGLADAQVIGASSREQLVSAIEERSPADWGIGLIDLEDTDGSMRGGRIIWTIREHPELRRRCMPAALTVHANPAMQFSLRDEAFAVISVASGASAEHLRDALQVMLERHPSEEAPKCSAFPDIASLQSWKRAFREGFHRHFGFTPHFGDDLVISHIAFDIPDRVTDLRLETLRHAGHPHARPSVEDFKREVSRSRGWAMDFVKREVRDFVRTSAKGEANDPVNPGEIETAAAAWRVPALRKRARVSAAVAPAVDAFFDSFKIELATLSGGPQNRQRPELALRAACQTVEHEHGLAAGYFEHVVGVLLDLLHEDPDALHVA